MTKQHRLTPAQWESIELWAEDNVYDACFLELRARIEALEAAQQPHQDKLDRLIALDADKAESDRLIAKRIFQIIKNRSNRYD
jgi:hypothetical protein